MHLETCDEPITSIRASIELETNHIGKGCDRDTYSEKSLHKLCGKLLRVNSTCSIGRIVIYLVVTPPENLVVGIKGLP